MLLSELSHPNQLHGLTVSQLEETQFFETCFFAAPEVRIAAVICPAARHRAESSCARRARGPLQP